MSARILSFLVGFEKKNEIEALRRTHEDAGETRFFVEARTKHWIWFFDANERNRTEREQNALLEKTMQI
jgi:hypothetical protein